MVAGLRSITIASQTYASFTSYDSDAFILKYKPDGNVAWVRKGGGSSDDLALSVAVDKRDSSIYAGGILFSSSSAFGFKPVPGNSSPRPFLVKLSASGDVLETFSPPGFVRRIVSLALASDGSVIFLGNDYEAWGEAIRRTFIGKYSSDGTLLWLRETILTLDGFSPHGRARILVDTTGNIYLGATFRGSIQVGNYGYQSKGDSDIAICKFSAAGEPIWAKTAGFIGDDRFSSFKLDSQGTLVITGVAGASAVFDDHYLEGSYTRNIFIAKMKVVGDPTPIVEVEPVSQTILQGAPATLEVSVTSPSPVTYKWFHNNKPIENAIDPKLIIPSVTLDKAGSYYVEISNAAGTTRSAVAQLVINGTVPIKVSTIGGDGTPGYINSSDPFQVRFNQPNGVAYYSQGIIAVADGWNHVIRLVDHRGAADTYAGQNSEGYADGPASSAKFKFPLGLAVSKSLDIIVADYDNHRLRNVSPFGLRTVSTLAGSEPGFREGPGATALLKNPNDVVVDPDGVIYFTDFNNHAVRKLTRNGEVTTIAGNGNPGYRDGSSASALLTSPGGLAIDASRNLYVTEYGAHRVRKISPLGIVSTIAGTNSPGFLDGQGSAARFHTPDGIAVDPLGNLYLTEQGNHAIRKIDPSGNVTTIAGLGRVGFQDGNSSQATFRGPGGIMWHPDGTLIIADTSNHALRRLEFISSTPADQAQLLLTLNPALTIFGTAGSQYRIEAAESDVQPLRWVVLDTITLTSDVEFWCDTQPATRKTRLYRAVKTR